MSNNTKVPRCKGCADVRLFKKNVISLNDGENDPDFCPGCYRHHNDHRNYDPRCPLCVVERIKALWRAMAIMIRQMLPPSTDES